MVELPTPNDEWRIDESSGGRGPLARFHGFKDPRWFRLEWWRYHRDDHSRGGAFTVAATEFPLILGERALQLCQRWVRRKGIARLRDDVRRRERDIRRAEARDRVESRLGG